MSSAKGGDPATRQRICEAALRLIVKRGGVDVPLADVAKAARVSRQALYLHFKDRAALFLADRDIPAWVMGEVVGAG